MIPSLRLLSTDFDGTLIRWDAIPSAPAALWDTIARLRRSGVQWAINTGRTLELTLEGLRTHGVPMEPDFILATERELYRKEGDCWVDFGEWNVQSRSDLFELFEVAHSLLAEIEEFLAREGGGEMIWEEGRRIGLRAHTEEDMHRIAEFIDRSSRGVPIFGYQRNWVYLRSSHNRYDKGSVLTELQRLIGVTAEETLALGDHHNDLSMLDGNAARYVACPSNAVDDVKRAVRKAGGYLARGCCGEGTLEALLHLCGSKP